MMIPLSLCSLIAVAIIAQRLIWGPNRKRLFPKESIELALELINSGRFEELLGVCRSTSNAFSRVLATALLYSSKPKAEMLRQVEVAGQKEAAKIVHRLGVLGTIAAVCPLLGLLGTVFGMISTFEVIQTEGVGNANALAGGIAEALLTTAAGLSIAIPSLVFYRSFLYQAKQLVAELEQITSTIVEQMLAATENESEASEVQ